MEGSGTAKQFAQQPVAPPLPLMQCTLCHRRRSCKSPNPRPCSALPIHQAMQHPASARCCAGHAGHPPKSGAEAASAGVASEPPPQAAAAVQARHEWQQGSQGAGRWRAPMRVQRCRAATKTSIITTTLSERLLSSCHARCQAAQPPRQLTHRRLPLPTPHPANLPQMPLGQAINTAPPSARRPALPAPPSHAPSPRTNGTPPTRTTPFTT